MPGARRMRAGAVAGLLTVLAIVPLVLALAGSPAAAHPDDVQAATDYRTAVTELTPAVPGLRVRFIADGSRLELRNQTGRTIEVLGYEGEPRLQSRPDGVWHNVRSPSRYVDEPTHPLAVHANAQASPEWEKVDSGPVARWHDHRTVWHGAPPPAVTADPTVRVRVRDWVVPLRDGGTELTVVGTLDWLPAPAAGLWWSMIALVAAAIAALGLVPVGPGRQETVAPGRRDAVAPGRRDAVVRRLLGAVCAAAGIAGLGYAATVATSSAEPGSGGLVLALVGQLWPIVTGLAALAASGAALAGRPAADFGMALAGACVAVMSGLGNAAVFAHPVAPIPFHGGWARLSVAIGLAGGAGVAAGAVLRLYRAGTPPRTVGTVAVGQ